MFYIKANQISIRKTDVDMTFRAAQKNKIAYIINKLVQLQMLTLLKLYFIRHQFLALGLQLFSITILCWESK